MNCPVCDRKNAVPLSVCPTCGTMINDTERIELAKKVSVVKDYKREVNKTKMPSEPLPPIENAASEKSNAAPPTYTSAINSKATSPTLVEFHNKNSTVPEWRLQLQNAVRQRQGGGRTEPAATIETSIKTARQTRLATSGANALKAEPSVEPQTAPHATQNHPEVARALERIQQARQKFFVEEEAELQAQAAPIAAAPAKASKNYPFYIAAKTNDAEIKTAEPNDSPTTFSKPKLAAAAMQRVGQHKLDTNKLPPLPKVIQDSPDVILRAASTVVEEIEVKTETTQVETVTVKTEKAVEPVEIVEIIEVEENATFAMRFNAGLFDLIIGSFVSAVLLAPFMLSSSGNWLSWSGLFAFVATCAVVMFIYLTTTVGLYGRTFGMRLFSLELVDIEGENYPTFHQAAVSSSVYLLSLACFGLGFLTVLFNEEKRAVHDLVSGTVVVREEEN